MKPEGIKSYEYEPLRPPSNKGGDDGGYSTLRPLGREKAASEPSRSPAEPVPSPAPAQNAVPPVQPVPAKPPASKKKAKREQKDIELLKSDRWLVRNGHLMTYIGLFLFSFMVLFRPYEMVPQLGFLGSTTIYFAIATLGIYIPSQIATEGNLTMLSTEVKAILAMTIIGALTIPIARDPAMASAVFNDTYIKAVGMFIVMINVVRTRRRLMALMWLSFGIGIYLSVDTIRLYISGDFAYEGYRVGITDTQGMFGNPNEMALHLVMMTPIVISLCLASKSIFSRIVYLSSAILFVAANVITFSRGGFLGLLASSMVLAWKLGRKNRMKVTLASLAIGFLVIVAAPGNYGLRLLSIFIPSLDPVGSADARREGLITSIIVTIRNPWGIGIGNSPVFGAHNLQTHNAFTQVSAELGVLGLAAYLVFIISPFRKLGAIERELYGNGRYGWFYLLSIGLQASIIGYMVSSFFASVAYNWFIYYLIAYAVAFRRVYALENKSDEEGRGHLPTNLQMANAR